MSSNKNLIVLPEGTLPALQAEINAEVENSLKEMMAGVDARPPQIKIAAGGSNNWLIGEDETAVKTLKGIILANTKAFAYWHKADAVANPVLIDLPEDHNYDIPLCFSTNGETGSREKLDVSADGKAVTCFGKCADCYLNQFGTAVNDNGTKGRGKACKNGRRLVVWVDGYDIPFLITLPPTSIRAFDSYITALRGSRKVTWAVWTIFNLEKQSRGVQNWSVFKPGPYVEVNPADIPEVYELHKQFKPVVMTDITGEDFETREPQDADFEIED